MLITGCALSRSCGRIASCSLLFESLSAFCADAATGGEIARALSTREFQAKPYELFIAAIADKSWRTRRVALIGGGRRLESGSEIVRKLATAGGLAGRQRRLGRVGFMVRGQGEV